MEVRARASLCCAARTPRDMLHGIPTRNGIPTRHGDRRQRTRAVQVVNHNVDALIKWKNRRIPFDDSATAQ